MQYRKVSGACSRSAMRFSLRLARYLGGAETVAEFVREHREAHGSALVRLLDVGVGRGRLMRFMDTHFEAEAAGIAFHGAELSPRRMQNIYERPRWRLVRANAEMCLPYADGSFDAVFCEQMLEHVGDPNAAVAEMCRVTRPGALVILGVPSFPPGLAWMRRHVVPRLDWCVGKRRSHLHVFTIETFRGLIEKGDALDIQFSRGFRFISGGPLRPLESYSGWYEFNKWLGRRYPRYATEIQIVARRR